METRRTLWRAVRIPVVILTVAVVLLVIATILDRTSAREYALVLGAPALTILLPIGVIWLVIALVVHFVRRTPAR